MEAFREFIYAMFVDCKRMSLASIANNTTINYQKLQYFFSESNWSIKELNDIRIKILQNQRTRISLLLYTTSNRNGLRKNYKINKLLKNHIDSKTSGYFDFFQMRGRIRNEVNLGLKPIFNGP